MKQLKEISLPLGVVLRRSPGVTRWAKWSWKAVDVIPGAGPAAWKEIRTNGDVIDFHAATQELKLYRADAEAYRISLSMEPPAVFVVLREEDDPESAHEYKVHAVTASAYEAQDYLDSGEELVEPVPMPAGLIAWVRDFTDAHFREEKFIKRKRDKKRIDITQDGIGDGRIRQIADVYRSPVAVKPVKKGYTH